MIRESQLLAIESIKQLKARYWRAIDSGDTDLLRSTFTPDCIVDFRGSMGEDEASSPNYWSDRESFLVSSAASFGSIRTVHHGFVPEITLDLDNTACAIWPMEDLIFVVQPIEALSFTRFQGWGHYHDRYRETTDGWRMSSTRLTRSRIEMS